MTLSLLPWIFPALMAFAASYDGLSMRIGNRLCLALAAAFFPAAIATGLPTATVMLHAACGLAVLAAGFVLFARGWIGGGDVKLAAAAALWFGWTHLADFMILTALCGGLLAVASLVWHSLGVTGGRPKEVPYGIALTAGALLVYPHSFWTTGIGVA